MAKMSVSLSDSITRRHHSVLNDVIDNDVTDNDVQLDEYAYITCK